MERPARVGRTEVEPRADGRKTEDQPELVGGDLDARLGRDEEEDVGGGPPSTRREECDEPPPCIGVFQFTGGVDADKTRGGGQPEHEHMGEEDRVDDRLGRHGLVPRTVTGHLSVVIRRSITRQ